MHVWLDMLDFFDEWLNIRRFDIMIYNTHMSIFIESSKTDKYRDGAWVVISRTGTALCQVENLERYHLWANIQDNYNTHVFGTLSAIKIGYKIKRKI